MHLRYGGLFNYLFTVNLSFSSVVKKNVKLVNTWRNHRQKGSMCHAACYSGLSFNWPADVPVLCVIYVLHNNQCKSV